MKRVVMLSTTASGGMAQVVQSLQSSGLFRRYGIEMISTHERGSNGRRLRVFITGLLRYLALLTSFQISVVHAHVAMRGSFWRKSIFLWLARLFRIPILVHLHGSQFEEFYEKECGSIRRALVRALFRQAFTVIVLSQKWRDYIGRIEPHARLTIIYNFVARNDEPHGFRDKLPAQSSNVILFLGELGQRKGIYDLVRAMPSVVADFPHAKLVAGGSGETDKVADLARECGVEKAVELPGWVSGNLKACLLAEAAIYTLPSHNENFPVSILEAMTVGLPIVSTPVGGIPDMIRNGIDGYLVEPGSVEQLAQRIKELLGSAELRKYMGANARQRVTDTFHPDGAIAAIQTLYAACGAAVFEPNDQPCRIS